MLKITTVSHYPKIGDSPEEQALRRALARYDRKEIDEAELEHVKDEVTRTVLEEQIEAGVEVVTDGEIRWDDAVTYLAGKIQGFALTGLLRYFDTNTFYRQPVCREKLVAPDSLVLRDFQFSNAISSVSVKAVLTGPFTLAKLSKDEHYEDLEALASALAGILGEEARRLAEAGASVIQFDEPALLRFKGEFPLFKRIWTKLVDPIPENVETILFLNFGDLEGIYPEVLDLRVTTLGLDLCKESRNWKILRGANFTKRLLAGIVDARNTKMETEEGIRESLEKLLQIVSAEDLAVSPNYGLEFLPRAVARKKLENLSKGVREFRSQQVKV